MHHHYLGSAAKSSARATAAGPPQECARISTARAASSPVRCESQRGIPLCLLWRPPSPPSPSLRQFACLSEAACWQKRRTPGPVPRPSSQPPPKSRTLPHTGPTLRRPRPGRTTGHPGEEGQHGRHVGPVAQEASNRRPPEQQGRQGPPPAEALRRRLPVGAPRTRKCLLAVARPRRRASRPRGARCGQ